VRGMEDNDFWPNDVRPTDFWPNDVASPPRAHYVKLFADAINSVPLQQSIFHRDLLFADKAGAYLGYTLRVGS